MKKKFFPIILSIIMSLTIIPLAMANDTSGLPLNGDVNSGLYELTDDVDLTGLLTIASSANVTIDLNGHDITAAGNGSAIYVDGGSLTIVDSDATAEPLIVVDNNGEYTVSYESGKITAVGSCIVVGNGGTVILESGTVESTAGNGISANGNINPEGSSDETPVYSSLTVNGGLVSAREYGVTAQGRGASLSVNDGVICTQDNAAVAGNGTNNEDAYRGGTVFNINGGTIISNITTSGYIACGIYHPQQGQLNITGGTIVANGGVGILMRGGQLNMTGGEIIATGNANGRVGDSKVLAGGYGIQIDEQSGYYDNANTDVDISNGSVAGEQGALAIIPDSEGGQPSNEKMSVTGGTFSSDVSAYLSNDMATAIDANGNYNVLTKDDVERLPTDNDGNHYLDDAAAAANNEASITNEAGTIYYATLAAAINGANSGDTVMLESDVVLTGGYSDDTAAGLQIEKSIIIDGQDQYTISTGDFSRGIRIYGGDSESATVDVTFKNVSISSAVNAGRCIDTRGGYISLTLDNATLSTTGSGHTQALTIGGNHSELTEVNISNGSSIIASEAGYGIITFNPVNLTIDASTVSGFAALYFKGEDSSAGSDGSVVTVQNGSSLSSKGLDGQSNEFGTIVFQDGNITVSITNSNLKAEAANPNAKDTIQSLILFSSYTESTNAKNKVSISGDRTTVKLIGDYAGFVSEYTQDMDNSVEVSGGTFSHSVAQYVVDSLNYEAHRDNVGYTYHTTLDQALATGGEVKSVEAAAGAADTHTVTLVEGGVSTVVTVTDSITLPAAPTRSGYAFLGWLSSANNQTYQAGATVTITADTTFTAQWAYIPPANPSYQITIPATANGTVTVSPTSAQEDTLVTITAAPNTGYEVGTVTVTDRNGSWVAVSSNRDGTWSFVMPASQVTVTVTFVESQPEPLPFTDVSESAWYYDAVRYVYENGLMNGVGGSLFDPNGTTNRAMVVTILWRLEGSPVVNYNLDYSDVSGGLWYTEAVRWATSTGIVEGYGSGFHPLDSITREQLSAILYRYAQYKGYNTTAQDNLSGYTDASSVAGWAQDSMEWSVGAGLINGITDTTIVPQGSAIRAQVAAILMRFCENVAEV